MYKAFKGLYIGNEGVRKALHVLISDLNHNCYHRFVGLVTHKLRRKSRSVVKIVCHMPPSTVRLPPDGIWNRGPANRGRSGW